MKPTVRVWRIDERVRVAVEKHGEGNEIDPTIALAIGGTNDGHRLTRRCQLALPSVHMSPFLNASASTLKFAL